MIHRVNNCFGLPLWKSKKRYIELWVCFSEVIPHAHPGQHVEIVPIFGRAEFCRFDAKNHRTDTITIRPDRWFRTFSIPSGWKHWFILKHKPLIFINIATGNTSVSQNFVTQ